MKPGLIPRMLSSSLGLGIHQRFLTFCGCGLRDMLALYRSHVGGGKSVLYEDEECTYLKNTNSLKSFQLKSVKRYPSREKARMALGPTHMEPSIRGVKCTPKNGNRGSGTWQGKIKYEHLEFAAGIQL